MSGRMTTPDPDAYPTREEDATAERLCRVLTRSGLKGAARVNELVGTAKPGTVESKLLIAETMLLTVRSGLVYLLRFLDADTADDVARDVWGIWQAGESEEFMRAWAREYGQENAE